MRAGVSKVEFPLEPGLAMMGYGARTGVAEGTHDSLFARALFVEQEHGRVLLVSYDVCLVAPIQAEQVRAQVVEATGLSQGEILVTCIHTHSGPETGFGDLMGGGAAPAHVAGVLSCGVKAAEAAFREARPARLGTGVGQVRIGRNRQRADGPIDPRVRVVRVDDDSGEALAVLYSHGCHPTVLGHENLAWSADWPWAAGLEIQEAFPGAEPIFLLGAHADVDPRTRGLQDLARPGRSLGVGFDQVEELGRELGAEVVRVARSLETDDDAAVAIRGVKVSLVAHAPGAADRSEALAAVGLAADARPSVADWYRLEHEATANLPDEQRRSRIAKVRRHLRNRSARRFAFGETPDVEVHWLRLGAFRFLAVPLEGTVEVGQEWARRTGRPDDGLLSIAGGWMRYLPHPRNFEREGGELSYEVLNSTFEPDAASTLLDLGAELDAQG